MAKFQKNKFHNFFWLETTSKNLYSGLKQLKMDLNALKCIQIHIPQKGQKNGKKWQKNVRKLQIIAQFQKLLNMVKK